jgi:hypothetical protein
LIAIMHNGGRQARILERQMYEMMVKAQYYSANENDARLEYLAMPFRDIEFMNQMGWGFASPRYAAAAKAANVMAQRFPDASTYARENPREKPVRKMVGPNEDKDAIHEYAFHYRRLSQTPHGTASGMLDVLDFRSDGNIGIRFDSWLQDPNFAIQNMTIYLIAFLELVNGVFDLGRESEIEELKKASEAALSRLWPDAYAEATDADPA